MINDKDLIIEDHIDLNSNYIIRETVRAIIINSNQILLCYSSYFNDYTFPGGGIKAFESHYDALKRELKEELGATEIVISDFYTKVSELKYSFNEKNDIYLQTSYYYMCQILKTKEQELAPRELAHGLIPTYIKISDAIKHNEEVKSDEKHFKKGLKTALLRENRVLNKIFEEMFMRKFEVVTKYLSDDVVIPKRASSGSAGYDLASIVDCTILPNEIKLIPTGLKAAMPKDEVLLLFPRSSLALKKGLMMSNSVGVIDSDYYNNKDNEGHIMVPLINILSSEVKIAKGDRIAQGVFIEYRKTNDDESESISRLGGFGSSGK
jgi:dUTP pyrophosphatase